MNRGARPLTFACMLRAATHAVRAGARASAVGSRAFSTAPTAILVTVDIEPSRVEAFRAAMAIDAAGSRLEPGCHRFDLLEVHSKYDDARMLES